MESMMKKIHIKPLQWWEVVLDGVLWLLVMKPLQIVTTRDFWERAQRTHRYNNKKDVNGEWVFVESLLVEVPRDSRASRRWWGWIPLFHMGGWRQYVVLAPKDENIVLWYVGWDAPFARGISRIALQTQARLLLGPDPVRFFGVTLEGVQIPLKIVAYGRLGDRSKYRRVPLL